MEVPVRVSAHRTECYNGNALDLHSEGQLSRILHDFFPPIISKPTQYRHSVPLRHSPVTPASTPHAQSEMLMPRSWSKQELPPPGLQTIPPEIVVTSRHLFIRITRCYSETGVNSLLSNPHLLTMHDFTVFSPLCYFCSRNSTANHSKYSDHLYAIGFNIQKF